VQLQRQVLNDGPRTNDFSMHVFVTMGSGGRFLFTVLIYTVAKEFVSLLLLVNIFSPSSSNLWGCSESSEAGEVVCSMWVLNQVRDQHGYFLNLNSAFSLKMLFTDNS
jgi:hypothetical protein